MIYSKGRGYSMAKSYNEVTRRKILTGNIWSVVLSITLPLFLYQLFNSLYSLIDAIMLVNISTTASSAGALLAQVKTMISSLGGGISSGAAILISRKYGAGDIESAKKYANVMFTIELVIISIILLVFIPLAEPIMRLCGCNDEIVNISKGYFRLQLVEQCIICLNNVFLATEKSKGNTKIIFIGNIIMMGIKLSLNALFVYGIKIDDMIYVELASIISQLFLFIMGAFFMFNKKNIFRIHYKNFSLDKEYSKKILIISLPLFLGKFVISLGKVTVNAICATFIEGDKLLVGALGVSNNICGLITNPGNAIEDSESSIVSQNLGNRNMKRSIKVFITSVIVIFIWSFIGFICVRFLFLDQIVNLFTTAEAVSQTYKELIKGIFYYDCLSIPSLAVNAVILGLLYGYGQTILATINNLVRIATRIGVLLICKVTMDTSNLENAAKAAGLSMGISNVVIATFVTIILLIFLIKTKRKGYKGMHFTDPEPEMIEVDGILVRKDSIKEA